MNRSMRTELERLRNQEIGELRAYSEVRRSLDLSPRQIAEVDSLTLERAERYSALEDRLTASRPKPDTTGVLNKNPPSERLTEPHRTTSSDFVAAVGWGLAIAFAATLIFF